MRIIRAALILAVLAVPSAARAQDGAPAPVRAQPAEAVGADVPATGEVRFGARLTGVAGDPGRFQRFRDLRSGPTVDRLRYTRDRETWTFDAAMDHVGYRDQRYRGAFERHGLFRASFEWDQVPLFYRDVTRSPHR